MKYLKHGKKLLVKDGISNDFYIERAAQKLAVTSIREDGIFTEKMAIES